MPPGTLADETETASNRQINGLLVCLKFELLHPLGGIDLTGADVVLGVGSELVDPMKLSGIAAAVGLLVDNVTTVAVQRPDHIALAFYHDEVLLRLVRRKTDVPGAAVAQRGSAHEKLLHERAILVEDLDPVVDAVADIHEPIAGDANAMHRIAELLSGWRGGVVGLLRPVVRSLPVGAPQRRLKPPLLASYTEGQQFEPSECGFLKGSQCPGQRGQAGAGCNAAARWRLPIQATEAALTTPANST